MSDSKNLILKLAQFGFTLPSATEDNADTIQKLTKILEQISAQYEQTKDIIWCCLDQQELPDDQKLKPTDAFHAITSEVHGILVQTSQMHKFYQQQLLDQRQINETLSQQITQLQNSLEFQSSTENIKKQVELVKQTYHNENQQLKQRINELSDEITNINNLNIQLEKENLVLKTMQPENTGLRKGDLEQEDDIITRRVIFQKDALQKQIELLQQEKQRLDDQVSQYNQLMELAKTKLGGSGIDQVLLQHYSTINSKYAQNTQELEFVKQENAKLEKQVSLLQQKHKTEQDAWYEEKMQLKQGWTEIYNEICKQLGVVA